MWFDQPGKPGPMRGLTRIELDKMSWTKGGNCKLLNQMLFDYVFILSRNGGTYIYIYTLIIYVYIYIL